MKFEFVGGEKSAGESPAALSHSQFQIQTGRKEDRTLSADTGIVLCADV